MIRALLRLADPRGRDRIRRTVLLAIVAGTSHGFAVALMVPVLQSLLGSGEHLGLWFGAMIAACLLHAVTLAAATVDAFGSSLQVIESMHTRLGRRLISLPVGWFSATSAGRASDLAVRGTLFVAQTSMDVVVPVVVNLTSPIMLVVVVSAIDWRTGLALALGGAVIAAVARWASSRDARSERALAAAAAESDARVLEFASHQAELRAAGVADREYAPLRNAIEERRRRAHAAQWDSVLGMVAQSTAVQVVFGTVVALSMWRLTGADGGDPVTAVALVAAITQVVGPLRVIASMNTALRASTEEIARISDLLETPSLPEPEPPTAPPDSTDVVFDGVRFGYDDRPVVRGLSATLPDRRVTAVVGPSGSGKTTLVRLIARLWDVDAGSVRIGGVDVRDLETHDLYGSMSLIFQDVYLFDDTLLANVSLGDPDADHDRIERAATLARLTEVVERLPQGWSTPLGENGARLSGGERQRVAIARALLRRAPLVLCDEPTSAVDLPTNRAITEGLMALAESATVVIVAHQLETIRNADHVLVIEDGVVAQSGDHDTLIATEGVYRRLFAQRAAAERWRPASMTSASNREDPDS
ncbi:ABC transporter ATP-binding protein [Gordonia hydrophobica]|uniref:ABC transporter ATP-binding protein n=1 Tax=Gordonia hydrophobica TaxID=40516 RepID=A0ABZ2U339_9ACTN|nr:ABC transporter ATP-binding protein [Gordonia hydrophobica]MBM7367309.1 ATP-binding cassette subfamily B protein [Gordonia hydrophobica]